MNTAEWTTLFTDLREEIKRDRTDYPTSSAKLLAHVKRAEPADREEATQEVSKFLAHEFVGERPIKTITAAALNELAIPPRKLILAPWWGDSEQPVVYGPRGAGKSWVTLGAAAALAAGGEFLRWKAAEPLTILYIDGEMMSRRLQERLRVIERSTGLRPGENLHILTPDLLGRERLNLWKQEDRDAVERTGGAIGAHALVLDNVATLYRSDNLKLTSNAVEWWQPIQDWLLDLRARQIAALTAVHTGKDASKGARGTSAIEDAVETSIAVTEAKDRKASDGAWFQVRFTKNRDFLGAGGETFEAKLEGDVWSFPTTKNADHEAAILDTLRESPRISGRGVLIRLRGTKKGMKERTFWDLWGQLEETGKIIKSGDLYALP